MVIIPGIIQIFPQLICQVPGLNQPRLGGGKGSSWGWFMGAIALGLVAPLTVGTGVVRGEIVTVGYDDLDFGLFTDSEVEPATEGLPQLSAAEQERLDTLLAVQQPQILSDISPNGSAVVVGLVDRLNPENRSIHFLDLNTGTLSPAPGLEQQVFSPHLPIYWISNDVLRFAQEDPYGAWEIVTFNRRTEIVSRTVVQPTQIEEGEILGLSPDFSKLVIRVYEGGEDVIYVVFLASLNRMEVARLPEGLEIPTPTWSVDGERMALVTSSIEQRRLYDRTPFSPNLSSPVIQDALGRLPPEDNLFRQRNQVRLFDFSQPEPLQFELSAAVSESEFFAEASLSADGELLLVKVFQPALVQGREHPTYLFPDRAFYRVYDRTGQLQDTIAFDSLSGPLESAGEFVGSGQGSSQRILFWGALGINQHLFLYDLGSNQLNPLPLPSGSVDWNSTVISSDGDKVVYSFSAVTQPPELFSLSLRQPNQPIPLTTVNETVAAMNQVRMDPVSFNTSNGVRQGFLVQPGAALFPPEPGPLVFWQEGGPGFSMPNQFATEVEIPLNLLPNFGIPVLVVALAGREGYGPELYRAQADGQNFGQVDLLEGREIVGQLVQDGWTTPGQVGISGCSYGGYYAGQIIARFPDLFAAANPQCSLLDTLTEWQLGYSSLLSYLVGQTPMENPDLYVQMSPLFRADQIRTPTVMFHGSDDFLQIDVARNFHDVVEASGVPITLYQFDGVGHSLYNPDYQRIAAQIQIDFFRQYLGQGQGDR